MEFVYTPREHEVQGVRLIARCLGMPASTVQSQLEAGNPHNLPVFKRAGRYVMPDSAFEAWAEDQMTSGQPGPAHTEVLNSARRAARELRTLAQCCSRLGNRYSPETMGALRNAILEVAERHDDMLERFASAELHNKGVSK